MARFGAQSSPVESAPTPPDDRLDSWKEIAAYLGRGVRTVQRWEREEGLPVHRLPHEKRGSVHAYRAELDAWWKSRAATLDGADTNVHEAERADVAATETPADGRSPAAAARRSRSAKAWVVAAGVVSGVTILAAVVWLRGAGSPPALTLQRVTTTTGRTVQPALSPDGRMVAYVSDGGRDDAPGQIWVQQIGSQTALQLTHDDARHGFPSFSADGTRILFSRITPHGSDLFEVPALGGRAPMLLLLPKVQRARVSPDGRRLAYVAQGNRLMVASADGKNARDVTGTLIGINQPVWSPDSARLLVGARGDRRSEPDWWIVAIDGSAPIETGVLRALRAKGFNEGWARLAPAWANDDQIVFSGRDRDGWSIWRQRIDTRTFAAAGEPERLTTGTTVEWWPSVAAGRLAYVSSLADSNIRSLPADTNAGRITGPLRRLTRGSGVTAYPSLSRDGHLLAFASDRTGDWDIYLKDLVAGEERVLAGGPDRQMYSAITPDGTRVAFGVVVADSETRRPVYLATIADGRIHELCDDCRGRPSEWLDARLLLLERFGGRRNSVALVDTATGKQVDLLASPQRAVGNPRLSPDRRWIVFEANAWRNAPMTFVARLNGMNAIAEAEWIPIDEDAAMPFWSPDGRVIYYVTGTTVAGQTIRGRRFDASSGHIIGSSFELYSLDGAAVPAFLTSGAALIATPDQIVMTLADFRGDVWVRTLPD
jgi:Tol biopolymer transport system component